MPGVCWAGCGAENVMSDSWAPLDAVLANATAALAAGDEDKALRLFDAAEELEKAIRGHMAAIGIKQQVVGSN